MSRETELAWAAGFFDGEGHIRAVTIKGKRGRPEGYLHLQMSAVQVRREPLDRFLAALGVGAIRLERRELPNNDLHRWTCGGNGPVRAAIEQLWPYLSLPKREQAERALSALRQDLEDNPRDKRQRLRERIVHLRSRGLTPLEIGATVGLSRRAIYYHLQQAKDKNNG